MRIVVINPGSTSTKLAILEGSSSTEDPKTLSKVELYHSAAELAACGSIPGQLELRLGAVKTWLKKSGIPLGSVDLAVGRGGVLRGVTSGIWEINEAMLKELATPSGPRQHASSLGAPIAHALAKEIAANGGGKHCAVVVSAYKNETLIKINRWTRHLWTR